MQQKKNKVGQEQTWGTPELTGHFPSEPQIVVCQ